MTSHQDALAELALALPQDRPFLTAEARARGVDSRTMRRLISAGLFSQALRGVHRSTTLTDTLPTRIEALQLVVPEDCVVTDRTAAWLWGAESALAPNDHLTVPRVHLFAPPGRRLRNDLTKSGERTLTDRDVIELGPLLVTTPLRTACDLARLLHRDQALAALDGLTALGAFGVPELCAELDGFRGFRGVIQARALAPLADPRSRSFGESVMRLRWMDAGLPRPECQVEVPAPNGSFYLLDMGLPEERFGGEYDGEEFHGQGQQGHDERRRAWVRGQQGWTLVVARKANVFGRNRDIERLLLEAYESTQANVDPAEKR